WPLVQQERQITVRLNPVAIGIPNDGLRRRPDNQRLFKLLTATVRDHSDFWSEPFDMLRLLLQKVLRNEQWKVGILVPGFLKHPIKRLLHFFPDGIAIGANDHAALYRGVIRKFGS